MITQLSGQARDWGTAVEEAVGDLFFHVILLRWSPEGF